MLYHVMPSIKLCNNACTRLACHVTVSCEVGYFWLLLTGQGNYSSFIRQLNVMWSLVLESWYKSCVVKITIKILTLWMWHAETSGKGLHSMMQLSPLNFTINHGFVVLWHHLVEWWEAHPAFRIAPKSLKVLLSKGQFNKSWKVLCKICAICSLYCYLVWWRAWKRCLMM